MMKYCFTLTLIIAFISLNAQTNRWQQKIKYTMNINMDVSTNRYTGTQKIDYWNNSPDTLRKVYFHLYWNAFQPNSMMDARSRRQGTVVLRKDRSGNDIVDWDGRVEDRILELKEDEIGYQRISFLKMNGRTQKMKEHETILEVMLDKPILPRTKVSFDMAWNAQVPIQVRRSGRDNPSTGVRYTMTQWYPKLAEYDENGWHPNPYIAREFYGVWGEYDVTIQIDKNYLLAGSGYVTNGNEIGHGYETKGKPVTRPAGDKLKWRILAPNVHDFAWAADPEYKHITRLIPNGPMIRVIYQQANRQGFDNLSATQKNNYGNDYNKYVEGWDKQWETMADAAVTVYPFIKKNFGEYPYREYAFIQGGDGGMEYPNCTMLFGPSLGTAFHEWMHTWYQMLMGTNESLYAWMDEGFTEWSTNLVEEYYRQQVGRKTLTGNPDALKRSDSAALAPPSYHQANYNGYLALARSGREEPLSLHADHFNTNYAYSNASYSKGAVFLEQLGYIIGADVRDRLMLEYYKQWRYKHPNDKDFVRLAEKVSGIELDWYHNYWINTTRTIDYSIDSLWENGGVTRVRLKNIGMIPMPIDLKITFRDGTSEWHYVPMYLMFGEKPADAGQTPRKVYPSWKWTHPEYEINTTRKLNEIVSIEIDPSYRMADINRKDNRMELKW